MFLAIQTKVQTQNASLAIHTSVQIQSLLRWFFHNVVFEFFR